MTKHTPTTADPAYQLGQALGENWRRHHEADVHSLRCDLTPIEKRQAEKREETIRQRRDALTFIKPPAC